MSYTSNPSQSEIKAKMYALREESREPVTVSERIFYSVLYFILVGWVVKGIIGLFKNK